MLYSLLRTFAVLLTLLIPVVCTAQGSGATLRPFWNYDQAIELTSARTRVVLSPQAGGRVLIYSLDGKNALFLDEKEKDWKPGSERVLATAGRFDIGPELVIPRRQTLWSGDWSADITGPRSARLTSPKDEATGVQLVRDFTLAEKSSELTCRQTMKNVSKKTVEWCHWSRTFSTGDGICVIPLSEPSRFPNRYVMYEEGHIINAQPVDNNIRVRDGFLEIRSVPRKPKLGFDSYAGWMAYSTRDDLLFVKRFATYPDRVYNEAAGLTMSVWYPEGARVELEPIGPRERLAPGESASFTEHWSLVPFDFPGEKDIDLAKVKSLVEALPKTAQPVGPQR